MKAFVQTIKGEFPNINFFTAYKGFEEIGAHVRKFDYNQDFTNLPLDDDSVVYGGIPVVTHTLARLDVPRPIIYSYPPELANFLGRNVLPSTLKEAREKFHKGNNFFIKPQDNATKLFAGHTLTKFRDLTFTAGFPDQTPVFTSDIIEITTEYRVFIVNGAAISAKHYRGDFTQMIDFDVVREAVKLFTAAPIAYALDFGLTTDGRTILIECNDCTSLGCYGLYPALFANMLTIRWVELLAPLILKKNTSEELQKIQTGEA